jgi:amino acid transporter
MTASIESKLAVDAQPRSDLPLSSDDADLAALGYEQKMHRTMGSFTSFALAFSMVSINTGVVTLFSDPFTRVGGIGILLWLLVIPLVGCIVLVYSHLAGRIPLTGYAYQWSSRLAGNHFGWFTGWVAFISFVAGTAATSAAIGSVFAPEIWPNPTQGQIQGLSIGATLVVGVLNVCGIRLATRINDIGAIIEIIGTVLLAVALFFGVFFFFEHTQGVTILTSAQAVSGEPVSFSTLALATLLPVSVLLGWEGAADLAEETKDPRRSAPRAMIRAVVVSSVLGFVVFALLGIAIPGSVGDLFAQSENPVINIVRLQLGNFAGSVMIVIAFASILACLIANMAVATRMTFALSRDNMLPGSKALSKINPHFGTPVGAILLITLIAVLLNLASGGFVKAIYSMVGLTYYCTYLLTLIAAFIAYRKGSMPDAPKGVFSLGRWLLPMILLGGLWALGVILTLSLPEENHVAALTTGITLAVGAAWWLVSLRGRLNSGTAGPSMKR